MDIYGRYETTLENRLFRAVHELERAQRTRSGFENGPGFNKSQITYGESAQDVFLLGEISKLFNLSNSDNFTQTLIRTSINTLKESNDFITYFYIMPGKRYYDTRDGNSTIAVFAVPKEIAEQIDAAILKNPDFIDTYINNLFPHILEQENKHNNQQNNIKDKIGRYPATTLKIIDYDGSDSRETTLTFTHPLPYPDFSLKNNSQDSLPLQINKIPIDTETRNELQNTLRKEFSDITKEIQKIMLIHNLNKSELFDVITNFNIIIPRGKFYVIMDGIEEQTIDRTNANYNLRESNKQYLLAKDNNSYKTTFDRSKFSKLLFLYILRQLLDNNEYITIEEAQKLESTIKSMPGNIVNIFDIPMDKRTANEVIVDFLNIL